MSVLSQLVQKKTCVYLHMHIYICLEKVQKDKEANVANINTGGHG